MHKNQCVHPDNINFDSVFMIAINFKPTLTEPKTKVSARVLWLRQNNFPCKIPINDISFKSLPPIDCPIFLKLLISAVFDAKIEYNMYL